MNFLEFVTSYICIWDFSITFFELLPLNLITSDVILGGPSESTGISYVLNLCPNYDGVSPITVFAHIQLINFFGSLECSTETKNPNFNFWFISQNRIHYVQRFMNPFRKVRTEVILLTTKENKH